MGGPAVLGQVERSQANGRGHARRMSSAGDEQAFKSLTQHSASGVITVSSFKNTLRSTGLNFVLDDITQKLDGELDENDEIDEKRFNEISNALILRALTGKITIPDWGDFCNDFRKIFEDVGSNHSGHVATYIPELAEVDPSQYAASVCTVDGQQFSLGDYDTGFCIQSCSKPISYLLAVDQHGSDKVHNHIGREPSGGSFNLLTLKESVGTDGIKREIPHNPMINAGAIMSIAMFKNDLQMAKRFKSYKRVWERLCGGVKLGFQNATYLSEKDTADRNFCLAYMMREGNAFPDGATIDDTLSLYFQSCCVETSCQDMAVMAATLANGGTNPITNDKIFDPPNVRDCLSLMLSCGMYDYSGEWAFKVGLPAKSGVGGSVFVVIPNVMGICVWSPRLDSCGNSVRGVMFAEELVKKFNFHHYEKLRGILTEGKKDPTLVDRKTQLSAQINQLLFAAAKGDLQEIRGLVASGVNLQEADYDRRTALHLASCEGHIQVVEYLITEPGGSYASSEFINFEDRWKETALDNAMENGQQEIVGLLKKAGAKRGSAHKAKKKGSNTGGGFQVRVTQS